MKRIIFAIDIISALLIFLFLYTAVSKLYGHENFRTVLFKSPLLTGRAGLLSWAIPFAELLAVWLLFIPRLRLAGLYLSALLLFSFTIYILYMLLYSPYLPCSCGGVLASLTWRQHVLLNIVFLLSGITGIILHKRIQYILRRTPP